MWSITTRDGKRIDGMLLRRDGQQNEVYVDASGRQTKVQEPTIADRKIARIPLPSGLVQVNGPGTARCRGVFTTEA